MLVMFNVFSWSFQNKFGIISLQIDRRSLMWKWTVHKYWHTSKGQIMMKFYKIDNYKYDLAIEDVKILKIFFFCIFCIFFILFVVHAKSNLYICKFESYDRWCVVLIIKCQHLSKSCITHHSIYTYNLNHSKV